MQYRIFFAVLVVIVTAQLSGCPSMNYRYDSAGNLTCVDYGSYNPLVAPTQVLPPVFTNVGDEFGHPRTVVIKIESPDPSSAVHFTKDGSTATASSPVYTGSPINFTVDNEHPILRLQAISVNACGAVSNVVSQDFRINHTFFPSLLTLHEGIIWSDDILYEGAQLSAECFVQNIEVILFNSAGDETVGADAGGEADDGVSSARIISYSLGGHSLEVKVQSAHALFHAVRYKVNYYLKGRDCALPPFTRRP